MGNYLFAGMLIGGFLMYLGLSELRKYSPAFIFALIGSILIILCSFWGTAVWLDSFLSLGWGISSGIFATVYDWIKFVVNFAFNIAMLYGIADISRRVELIEMRQKAVRNMIYLAVFNVYQIILFFPIEFIKNDQPFFFTILLIFHRFSYTNIHHILQNIINYLILKVIFTMHTRSLLHHSYYCKVLGLVYPFLMIPEL